MRRRQPALLLATAAAVVALGTIASERPAAARLITPPSPRCDRALQVMATPHVAIVRGRGRGIGNGFYACTRRARRGTYLLDAEPDGIRVRIEVVAAGWFVAFATANCDKYTSRCEGEVKVYDGRKRTFRVAPMRRGPDGSALYAPYQPVVTRRGWAAWAVPRQTTPGLVDVYMMTPTGTVRLIATSLQIDPRSIATDGHRIYWFDTGQARSAPLR